MATVVVKGLNGIRTPLKHDTLREQSRWKPQKDDVLAVVAFMTDASTLRTAAKWTNQTTRTTLKYILQVHHTQSCRPCY